MPNSPTFTRRRLLQGLGIGYAGFLLRDVLLPGRALAASSAPPKILVFCYFSGGWDQLMSLDPRPFSFGSAGSGLFPQAGSPIDPAWDQIDDQGDPDSLGNPLALNAWLGSAAGQAAHGLVSLAGTNLSLGPAFYDTTLAKDPSVAQSLCVVRGINMGTLTHEVGRRYFITGKFPRGLEASGSALPTWVAAQNGPDTGAPIPNLSVGVETYNEGLPAYASGLLINQAGDLVNVLQPLGPAIRAPSSAVAAVAQAVSDFEAQNDCWEVQLNGTGLVDTFRDSRLSALSMVQSNLAGLFTFSPNSSNAQLQQLFKAFEIDTTNNGSFYSAIAGAKGQALIAAQAVTPAPVVSGGKTVLKAVSNCVSIQLATGIDTHDTTWTTLHGAGLRKGFDALGLLIRYLMVTPDPLVPGHMLFERTQLMGFSEFARTPNINSRGGRDHHLSSSCLLAGAGIKGAQVVGGTEDSDFQALPINLATGTTQGGTYTMRPPDIHATFLHAAGLDDSNLSNQQPVLIPALLSR
jgi:hypothetical protein